MIDLQKRQTPPDRAGFDTTTQTEGNRLQGNSSATFRDPRVPFIDAMTGAGIVTTEPDRIAAGGEVCRFHVDGDKRGSRNGWAVLFTDTHGSGGAFGHWRTGASGTWHEGHDKATPAERRRLAVATQKVNAQREADRLERSQDAQQRAQKLWASSSAAQPDHHYLTRKQIQPHGIRQRCNRLVVPVRDADGALWSLQFIFPNGQKRFMLDGRKRGCYFAIGQIKNTLLICEGLATGASLYESLGEAVAVAFDAGNLEPVAKALRAKYPQASIIICADNDVGTDGNPGLTNATAAARSVRGRVALPPEPFNDFNDVACGGVCP